MRRRDFIKIIPGLAAACPLLARAQQFKRRIGVVIARLENDPVGQAEIAALFDNLRQLGWTVGAAGNSQVDYRWPGSDIERIRADVVEIVGLHPDVIIAHSIPVNLALQRATRTIPIVFVNVTDPIGSGLVESLAHPGGNITGFSNYESGLAIVGKWIETLKEIDRRIERFRSTCSPVAVSSAPRQGCGGPPAPGKDLKRVEIFSSQGTLETDKGELSGSSATGGATVSGARRKDARPSALSVSPIILRVEIAGRDRIARAQRAIGEIDRPLGQEMLAKAMMKFHELARRLAEEIGGRGPLVSAPRRFVHAPARAYPMLGRRGEASDGEARLSPQIKNSCKMVGAAARYTTHVFVRAARSIAAAVACPWISSRSARSSETRCKMLSFCCSREALMVQDRPKHAIGEAVVVFLVVLLRETFPR